MRQWEQWEQWEQHRDSSDSVVGCGSDVIAWQSGGMALCK